MSLQIGDRLGPYEVVGLVGKGGMGAVFRARDSRLSRDVAIKVLQPALAHDADRLRRFEQEARAAGQLSHPNIVTVFDVGARNGSPYIVQELLEGETLAQRLASGPLPHSKALQLAIGIANGLAMAHSKGVLHRDLKPANLFITRDGRVKILDFGLAKLLGPLAQNSDQTTETVDYSPATSPGVLLGTAGYMSPEQVRGGSIDARSDIFSCGSVFYEMLSGQRAFRGSTAAEMLSAILNSDPPELSALNEEMPEGLDAIVRHCLEKDPTQRFQSAQDLAFHLSTLESAKGFGSTRLRSTAKDRRRAATLLVPFALLAALVGFALGHRKQGTPTPPTFTPLTFQHGWINDARFGPDGQTIFLSATWNDDRRASVLQGYTGRSGWLALGYSGYNGLAVSKHGELALLSYVQSDGHNSSFPSLARAPLAGGAPRVLRGLRDVPELVYAMDWTPDGEDLAVVSAAGRSGIWNADRLEWPLGHVIADLSDRTFGLMRIAPDGQRLAVFEDGTSGSTLVLYRQNGERTSLSSGWTSVNGLAWARHDAALFVSGCWNSQPAGISMVKADGSVVPVTRIPGSVRLLDVAEDGRALVANDDTRIEARAFPPGGSAEVSLSWSREVLPRTLSPDGRHILWDDGSHAWLGPSDGTPPVLLANYRALALSPDAKSALVWSGSFDFRVVPVGSGGDRVIAVPGLAFRPPGAWLDNDRVVLGAKREATFGTAIVSLKKGPAIEFLPTKRCFWPVASADGEWVACDTQALPIGGGTPKAIAPANAPPSPTYAWDTDGRHVYKLKSPMLSWPLQIERVEVGTGTAVPWKTIERPDRMAGPPVLVVVAQDGVAYAYAFRRDESQLYLVENLPREP